MATQLEGVRDATAKINELGVKFAAKNLRASVKTALEEAEHRARARIPVGSVAHITYRGRLVSGGFAVSTLHIETRLDKRTGAAVATLGVGREAFYAALFVELGTAYTPAQPWLRPAFEESQDGMLRTLAAELKERAEKVARKQAAGKV